MNEQHRDILVAYDGSPDADEALLWAAATAVADHRSVRAVMVIDRDVVPPAALPVVESTWQEFRDRAEITLKEAGVNAAQVEIVRGPVVPSLLKASELPGGHRPLSSDHAETRPSAMTTTSPTHAALRDLIAQATRAPSVHNTQPWHWCVAGERVSLFADTSRQLPYADPDGRDLVISCGAALHHLRVAAAAAGWAVRVRRMPNPYNDDQLANVAFSPAPATHADIVALDALVRRRTDRRHPASWPVPRDRLDELLALSYRLAVTVAAVVSPQARAALLQLLAEADDVQRRSREYVDEIVSWTARTGPEGIPPSNLVRRTPSHDSLLATSRFPSGTLPDHDLWPEAVPPTLLAICTSSDDTGSRLRAGEALSAILLKGTSTGLSMVPLSQAVEVDRTRRLLQDELLGSAACPQIIVQVGLALATSEVIPQTPRRPVSEVTSDVASLPARMGPYRA